MTFGTAKRMTNDLVTLRTFRNRAEADTAKSLLDSQNIETFVISDDAGGMDPALAFANGVQLKVYRKDLERAKKLLGSEYS